MHPILIYPGVECYDAGGFHCLTRDGHTLHCQQCHDYATNRMTRETITVYRHPSTAAGTAR